MKRSPLHRKTPLRQVSRRRLQRQRQWWQTRKWVEDRARGMCEARLDGCAGRGCHAHHLLPRAQGGPDTLDNLAWLCASCHLAIHENPTESYAAGWLRKGSA